MAESVIEATETYAVGPTDLLLLFGFVGLIVYWFMHKNTSSKPALNGLVGLNRINKAVNDLVTSDSSGFVSKMIKSGKTIAIFYGSQTGTAEEFSQRLCKDSQRYGLKAGVFDPEECEMDDLAQMRDEILNSIAVFVVATYGEGDPTDNAIPFFDWLKESPEVDGLNYAVFSLGNKTYEHYQAFGRFVDKKLEEIGANCVCPIGEGDDDANIEEDFVAWREIFWNGICDFYGVQKNKRSLSTSVSRDYSLQKISDLSNNQVYQGEITKLGAFSKQKPPYDAKNPYLAPVIINCSLHKGGDRCGIHIEIDISNSGIRYEAGDHVAVYPANDSKLVESLAKCLNINLDEVISLNSIDPDSSKKHPFPCPTSYCTALTHYVDITSTVKRHVLAELISYTKDEKDREKLNKLSDTNKASNNKYNEWIVKDHRHITQILEDLPSCKPPLDLLLELLPRLHCRYYSISSSSKMHKDRIHITAVVVDWISRIGKRQKGVATNWLKMKVPGDGELPRLPIFVRSTNFRLPEKSVTPVLMVGPGTGLAPFRGFIQDRYMQKQNGKSMGETILYFGCRHETEDFIYEEELMEYKNNGTITDLHLAFSRDGPQKVYVTHKLKENIVKLWEVIKTGGHIYVCGEAKYMAKDVHQIVVEAITTHGGKSSQQAENFVKGLSNKGKYSVDVW